MKSLLFCTPALLQAAAAISALVTLTMSPPAVGRILIVALPGQDAGAAVRTALAARALLLETGPLPGSIIVYGNRASIARHVTSWNMVLLAAPPAACGDIPAESAA